MKKVTLKSLLIIALAIIPMTFFGQENNDNQKKEKTNYWYIDADAGGAFLVGDNGNLKFNRMRFNGHLGGGYAFAKCLTAYGKIGLGTLSATSEGFFTTDMVSYVSYDLNMSIDLLNLFKYIRDNGNISDDEMLRTFNCGVGFIIVTSQKDKKSVIKHVPMFLMRIRMMRLWFLMYLSVRELILSL